MNPAAVTAPCTYHGEGPVWDGSVGVLRWVDMLAGDILTMDSGGDVERRHVSDVAAAVRPRLAGGLVVAVERGFVLVDADWNIGPVARAFSNPQVRMNDGGCDPCGRFFCGSMAYDMAPGAGALYRLDADGRIKTILDGVTISNGIAWSRDGRRVYFIDSGTGRVDVFDYDLDEGSLHDRRPLVSIPVELGMPDGMALDEEGGIWVALWGGGAVHRYSEKGVLDEVVPLPASQVTACAFGGPELADLYITTSRIGVAEDEQPAAGALFRVEPGIRGLPTHGFAG